MMIHHCSSLSIIDSILLLNWISLQQIDDWNIYIDTKYTNVLLSNTWASYGGVVVRHRFLFFFSFLRKGVDNDMVN